MTETFVKTFPLKGVRITTISPAVRNEARNRGEYHAFICIDKKIECEGEGRKLLYLESATYCPGLREQVLELKDELVDMVVSEVYWKGLGREGTLFYLREISRAT